MMKLAWLFLLLPSCALATTMDDPITDIINLLTNMESYEKQLSLDSPNIANFTQGQLTELQNEWTALSKSYGMSDTENQQNARLWSADDWNAVLTQASGGNNARFQQLMQSYSTMYPTLQNGNPVNAKQLVDTSYQQQGNTYRAALAASAYTYDDINSHIQTLENILHQVDDASKNQNEKAAIDLNSRLVAELGFIQLELLKLQSIHTQLVATKQQSDFNANTIDKQFTEYKQP